ncbi:MAG: FKBP-type peptidyl-prolyl cis-trans isomerase [Candidatus Avelusimicrobium sp.]|uniref:FKBP-type peptidyl-prolyl cis-trans isomerase n=1 Tax=Candidatus Avelusimicrobium sp. TaxID=3048833 RepID=UPI003F118E44
MKKLILLTALFMPLSVCAQDAAASAEDLAERNKMLYSLGFLLGDNLKRQLVLDNEDDFKALSQGMRDSLLNKKPQTDVEKYKPQIIEKYERDAQLISAKRAAQQQEYLENFKKEKGVKELDNGALIQLSRAGKGKTPKADDTIKVHYTGTLIDGTKFDSSIDRGEAFQTKLTDVIPCWTKAMQQMKKGARAKVVCPPETAYGNRPVGQIPANSVLVFDVEMIEMGL